MAHRSSRPLITSEDGEAIRDEWAALHRATPGATPFTHPAWYEAWLRHFGPSIEPVYLAFRHDEALFAVLVLEMDGPVARMVGDPSVCDYGGPLVPPGEETAVVAGLLEWLREDMTPAFEGWGVSKVRFAAAFEAAAADGGWRLDQEHEAVAPGLDLPADWDTYVAGLSKHDRHELRRKLRHFEASGPVSLDAAVDPESVAAGMDSLFAMMRRSRADKAEFLTPQMEAFFRDVAFSLAAEGMTRLVTVSLDGRPLASTLSFVCGAAEYLWNSGYDREFAAFAPGLLSKALGIRSAIERGLGRYDFLRGDEPYKAHLGGIPREIIRLRLRTM